MIILKSNLSNTRPRNEFSLSLPPVHTSHCFTFYFLKCYFCYTVSVAWHRVLCKKNKFSIKRAEHWRNDAFELWCWRRLSSPLHSKEIQPVHPKGDQSWIFIGRTDAEAETPILWPPDEKNWLIWKDSDAGKDWRQEEKGTTEDEMVGWHHQLDEHETKQAPGLGGQGGLVCHQPWGCKESDTTERLNWTELMCPCPSQTPYPFLPSFPLATHTFIF